MSHTDPSSTPSEKKSNRTHRKPVLFGFAETVREPGRRPRLRWRVGRILAVLAVLLGMAYFSGVTALYFFYKYKRDFDDVRFTQMLVWPFQRSAIRQEMGEYFIGRAEAEMEAGNFLPAFHYLRNGLARAPQHLEARRLLAEFYEFGTRRPDMAADLLEQGLRYAGQDPEYLRHLMGMLLRNQMDERVQALADEKLAGVESLPAVAEGAGPDAPPNRARRFYQMLAFSAAQAHYYRGGYDRAEDLLSRYDLKGTHDGIFLNAMIHWQRGRQEAAIALLESGIAKFPESEQYYVQMARFLRERGEFDKAIRYSVLRTVNNPLNPAPRIELLYAYHQQGQTEREAAEVESLLRQYATDEKTLLLLANFAAETGQPSLARRIYNLALQRSFDISGFALLVIESEVVAGAYDAAIGFSEELTEESPDWLDSRMHIFNSLRSVAYLGSGNFDLGQLYLTEFLSHPQNRVETLLAVSSRLTKLDLLTEAARVLRQAYAANPENQAVLSELIRVEMRRNQTWDLAELVTALLDMRRPSYQLLEQAYTELGSDRYLFTPGRENVMIELKAVLAERESV